MNKSFELKTLQFEKIIWIVFIFLSVLNLIGDNIQEKYLLFDNSNDEKQARDIFLFTVLVSVFIYLYFVNRNYIYWQDDKMNGRNAYYSGLRVWGGVLTLIGVLIILYVQLNEKKEVGTPSI